MRFLSTFVNIIFFSAAMANKEQELVKADIWLMEKGLNTYGDAKDTMYIGGTPLFNEMTGILIDRLEYLLEKFPDKPWEVSVADRV